MEPFNTKSSEQKCQARTLELLFIIFHVLNVRLLIRLYMWIKPGFFYDLLMNVLKRQHFGW